MDKKTITPLKAEAFDSSEPNPELLAGSSPLIVARLRDEIAASEPITFARFMDVALYDPEDGYYRAAERRPGRSGDFLTAPEATPLFGISIARQIADCWERLGSPAQFVLREYGAGVGGFAYDILAGLSEASPGAFAAIEYRLVDVNEAVLGDALAAMSQVGLSEKVEAELAESGVALEPIEGVVLANEVADALPVHRLVWRDGEPRELLVGWRDGWFAEFEGSCSAEALQSVEQLLANDEVGFSDGDRFEVSPAAANWFRQSVEALRRGYSLTIDYGYPAVELYRAHRLEGTVRGYAGHTVTDDPFLRVGRQDLTAHIDFSALIRAGETAGMRLAGLTTQGDFLAALGLGQHLVAMQQEPGITMEQYLAAQAAVLRLIDPAGLGRFRVLAMAKDAPIEPPLHGFKALSGLF
jgi:SAM-dependent MidA family methyltransferase